MKNILLIPVFVVLLFSCNQQKNGEKNETDFGAYNFFETIDLGSFWTGKRLIIYANFDECGEWGGHQERFEIYAKGYQNYYAKYIRTKVDCEQIDELYGKPEFQQPDTSVVYKLTGSNTTAINTYLSKLIKSKIVERFPGHAGHNFGVVNSDSTFMIDVYDYNKVNLDNYNILLRSFKIKIVDYDDLLGD